MWLLRLKGVLGISAQWYLPSVITNPAGSLWDVASAFPFGVLSMLDMAPTGSKEARVKAAGAFVPVKDFQKKNTVLIEKSKKTSPEAKTFWSADTIPEPFPGYDLLGEYGKYIPLIIIGVVAIWLLPRFIGKGE